jgi:hypothetical protein
VVPAWSIVKSDLLLATSNLFVSLLPVFCVNTQFLPSVNIKCKYQGLITTHGPCLESLKSCFFSNVHGIFFSYKVELSLSLWDYWLLRKTVGTGKAEHTFSFSSFPGEGLGIMVLSHTELLHQIIGYMFSLFSFLRAQILYMLFAINFWDSFSFFIFWDQGSMV